MASIVEVLNNHINSRFSYIAEDDSSTGGGWKGKSKGGMGIAGGLAAIGAGIYGLHKLTSGDEHEGSLASDIGHSLKYHLRGDLDAKTDAEVTAAQEHQARLQNLANQHQSGLDKIHQVLPQSPTAPQPQAPTAPQPQPQSQPTIPQASANQDENHAAAAIKHVGQATSQFVQQNPLAAGAIGTAGAIGAGIMAKRAMQNNRQ
jgi:ElaB/YqjD/DUF883 family membrane-anchored ribosome-binding protein